jgi:DNA-binding LacI/PurR family transcriptional regulator
MGNEPLFRAFQQVMRGCEHELGAASYRLVFMDTLGRDDDTTRELEGRALDSLIEHPVAGLIVWCQDPVASSQKLDRLRSAGTHIVAIDRVIPNLETDFVGVDNFHAARYAAEHLWELGHRRMGLITLSEKVSAVMDRESGFRSALSRFGMPFDEKNLYRLSPMPANRPEEFAAITKKIFEREDRPTAVFAVNDIVAWRLLQSITAAGYRVPEDMAVVGFDDIESRAMHAPVITTIRQSYEAIGRYAADLLLQRLKAPNSPLRHVLLDTSLVVRASTVAGTEAIGSAFRTTWVPGGPNETIANVPLAHPNAS